MDDGPIDESPGTNPETNPLEAAAAGAAGAAGAARDQRRGESQNHPQNKKYIYIMLLAALTVCLRRMVPGHDYTHFSLKII